MRLEVALHGFAAPQRSIDVEPGDTYADLLRRMEIPLESVIVTAADTVVPADTPIDPERRVRLVRIVSGG